VSLGSIQDLDYDDKDDFLVQAKVVEVAFGQRGYSSVWVGEPALDRHTDFEHVISK